MSPNPRKFELPAEADVEIATPKDLIRALSQHQRDQLFSEIVLKIRQSLQLKDILHTTVNEVFPEDYQALYAQGRVRAIARTRLDASDSHQKGSTGLGLAAAFLYSLTASLTVKLCSHSSEF